MYTPKPYYSCKQNGYHYVLFFNTLKRIEIMYRKTKFQGSKQEENLFWTATHS